MIKLTESMNYSGIEQIVSICSNCRTIGKLPFGIGGCSCGGSYHTITEFEYFDETNKKLDKILERLNKPWYRRIFS